MKKLLVGLMIVLSLTFACLAQDIDEAYIFTPEELSTWSFANATASVKDGYLSIIPNEGKDVFYTTSPALNLETEYATGLTVVMEIISKDSADVTGNGLKIYTVLDEDAGASETHTSIANVWSHKSGEKSTYTYDFSAKDYWATSENLKSVRWDPNYNGTKIQEVRVYEFYFTPGKPVEKPAEIDPAYTFTPEELMSWSISGASRSVNGDYLSIVPTKDVVYTYSSNNLGLELEYMESLELVMEVITKDGNDANTNGIIIYTCVDDDTAFTESHKMHASTWTYQSGVKKTYKIDFANFAYLGEATTLNQIRIDPTYSGTGISEIRIYSLSFTPGKPYVKPAELVPGVNVFTGTTKAFNFEDQTDASYFTLNGTDKVNYSVADDPTGSGRGKVLQLTRLDDTTATIYHDFIKTLEFEIDRPVYLALEAYGKNQPVFWLGVNPGIHIGTLKESWSVISKDNTGACPIRIQFATGASYSKNHYIDNFAIIPYYNITYTVEYPDGSKADNVVKTYFDASKISIAKDGTVTGLPESYPVENLEFSFAGYKLAGWSTQKGATTTMSTVNLNNEDVVLYPVWEESNQSEVNLTVYFDENKTASKTETVLTLSNYTLPAYADLEQYTPNGKIPLGFDVNGTVYAPGRKILIPDGINTLTISAVYGNPSHPEYGELVFLENFESFETGTHVYNAATGTGSTFDLSYLNPDWSTNKSHFKLRQGDAGYNLVVVDETNTNKALKATKINASTMWPNFMIMNQDTTSTPDGHYTVCADFMAPESEIANMQGFYVRIYYNGTGEYTTSPAKSLTGSGGKYVHVSFDLPVAACGDYTQIDRFQIFATTNAADEDTFVYMDNVSLYYKKDHAAVKVSETDTLKTFFIPGDTITLPDKYEISKYIPDGYVHTGFMLGEEFYEPASTYETKTTDSVLNFTAVYEEKEFALKFKTGKANGTIGEIALFDGDIVTLPADGLYNPNLTLTGWKIYGTDKTYNAGVEFTFDHSELKTYLDGTDRLVFEPVFTGNDETVYGFAGEITVPAGNVTLATLVDVADKLYYGVRRVTSKNTTIDAKLLDMVAKGVIPAYADTTVLATYEDAAIMLANVLPEKFYDELCYLADINGGDEALKLVRAGIFDESVDFTSNISNEALAFAVEKLVNKDQRSVENKRTFYVIGDSLTAAMGWVQFLPEHLTGNIEMVNHGINSMNTSHYISRTGGQARANYLDMMTKINKGDYVIIALGTNDSTLWSQGSMTYNQSRDNYYTMVREIRAKGAIPFLVCPVGRNTVDENGVYIESDPLIIECMEEANELYSLNVPIVNFKTISLDRMRNMTPEERAKIYADSVHYTSYGGKVVAGWFGELIIANDNLILQGFRNHFIMPEEEIADGIEIELGQMASEGNVRFAEINGIQYEITGNTYTVYSGENMLVEIVEKENADNPETVKTQYFYIDAENSTATKLSMDSYMHTYNTSAIRTESPMGIRFKSHIAKLAKFEDTEFVIDEYGFVIATQSYLDGKELTLDTEKKVTGVAYNKESGTDIIFNNDNDEYSVFTAMLINIPATQYKTKLVCKTYTKITVNGEQYTVYGEPVVKSVYETAKTLLASNSVDEATKNRLLEIIETVEGSIFIDVGRLYNTNNN